MPTYIDKLAWVHLEDRKLLSTRSAGKDTFYIPGGKREGDESDTQALLREIREELSVDLVPDSIKYLNTFEAQAHGKPEGTIVRMTCYDGSYITPLKPAAEIEEMIWFTYAEGYSRSSIVDKLIFDWLKQNDLID